MSEITLPAWLVFTAAPLAAIGFIAVVLVAMAMFDPDEDY